MLWKLEEEERVDDWQGRGTGKGRWWERQASRAGWDLVSIVGSAACVFFPISPSEQWRPTSQPARPAGWIIGEDAGKTSGTAGLLLPSPVEPEPTVLFLRRKGKGRATSQIHTLFNDQL